MNPGPPAPKAGIIPLDHWATYKTGQSYQVDKLYLTPVDIQKFNLPTESPGFQTKVQELSTSQGCKNSFQFLLDLVKDWI